MCEASNSCVGKCTLKPPDQPESILQSGSVNVDQASVNRAIRELKHETFEPRTTSGSDFETKSDVTSDRPQVTDVETEVLPSVLTLQKREKISRL